jgi:hypothetical protein
MSLAPGTRLGPYEIREPIGAGGMGEVYKARDTRLDRTVAIKVGAAQFSERFEREARAVAALNHPHICTLHDVGPDYLVMEYVEGKPLTGPLPMEDVLRYGIQIADALDAAHRKGIIHRDLKPANILLTKSAIKLLDFGLAKLTRPAATADATVTRALTKENAILGTLQYMSPEQLQGKDADARSDIFAFGCVVYELITGRRAFEGDNAASIISAVMTAQPAPPPEAPPPLDHLIRTCLAKDPDERRQTIHDVLLELRWLAGASGQSIAAAPAPRRARISLHLGWIAATLLAICTIALAWIHFREPPAPARKVHFTIDAPDKATFTPVRFATPEISPDGSRLAFSASLSTEAPRVWVRPLDSNTAQPLAGTDSASYPFWSGDSRYLAFFAEGKLKRIAVSGGPAETVCSAPAGRGGTWQGGLDGVIVFGATNHEGLSRVRARGEDPVLITKLDSARKEISHRVPSFLPDGRHFLYVAANEQPENDRVLIGDLSAAPGTPGKPLMSGGSCVRWAAPGHLLFVRERNLFARTFDLAHLDFSGDPFLVTENIATGGNRHTAASRSPGMESWYTSTHRPPPRAWPGSIDRAKRWVNSPEETTSIHRFFRRMEKRLPGSDTPGTNPETSGCWILRAAQRPGLR